LNELKKLGCRRICGDDCCEAKYLCARWSTQRVRRVICPTGKINRENALAQRSTLANVYSVCGRNLP
jgi:hypothetical protein